MKIIRDNCIYVQMKDIAFLIDHDMLDLSYFGDIDLGALEPDDFVRYTDKKMMKYIDGLHFIVSYDQVKDDSVKDITDFIACIEEDMQRIVSGSRTIEDNQGVSTIYDTLEHKIATLIDIRSMMLGESSIVLPDGVDYPSPKGDNKIKKLIGNLLNK